MDARTRTTLPLPPILPRSLRKWAEPIEPALQKLLVPERVIRALESARGLARGVEYSHRVLGYLDIDFAVDREDLRHIPAAGPLLTVANHPFGIVEGLVLSVLFDRIRPDWKVMANSLLSGIRDAREQLIPVNPFATPSSHRENIGPLREALSWLSQGGALSIFPGGEVASLNWMEKSVTDPPWKTTAARLALRTRCTVLPIFFAGSNSVRFHLVGTLHPTLRTLSLPREFERLSGTTVRLRIGHPISAGALAEYPDARSATSYLRSRTFFLVNRSAASFPRSSPALPQVPKLARPESGRLLAEEVAALPDRCQLLSNADFAVYLVSAASIPALLPEIGRCREQAFRQAGEGSGEETDLDRFDRYYQHLFLWSKAGHRLAGAYRLAITTDVLPQFGIDGLYTSTLFRYDPRFFERVGPAVELGRSFVVPEYQKNYASLLLLWKGITRAVQRRPEASVLYGAVSISSHYQAASRGLMMHYLAARASHKLARFVQPRKRFNHPMMRNGQIRQFASLAAGIEDISLSVADIEADAKGVPVLLRQYLKAGGRFLGFNLDPNFSNVLDALILADLRTAPLALLERCMGRAEANAFLAPRHLPASTGPSV